MFISHGPTPAVGPREGRPYQFAGLVWALRQHSRNYHSYLFELMRAYLSEQAGSI